MTPELDSDTLEALAALPTLQHPTASPDGTEIAYYHDVTGRNELHVLDVATGETEQWSDGEVPRDARWFLEWDYDGERVFFHRDEDGNEQNDVYALGRDGLVEAVVESDGQNVFHDVAPDGEFVVVGSTRDGQMNLYRHDADGTASQLTDYDRAVWSSALSPDGERLAYSTNEREEYDNVDVYVAAADGSNPRNLDIGAVGAEANVVEWGPDGDRLLVSDNTEDLTRCGVYDCRSAEVTWLGDIEFEETPVTFTAEGNEVVATRYREAAVVPVVYDLETGESREFDLPEGVSTFGTVGPTGDAVLDEDRIILLHTTPTRRPELRAYDLEADEATTLLEAEYGPFSPEDFVDAAYFTVESDGVPDAPAAAVEHDPYETLEIGALLYDSGERPSPLVVNPHGGPRHRDTKSWDLYTQFLLTQGFSILQVNYRGSTGHGREFVEALYDDLGGAEQGDIATALETVLDRGWVDEDRVVVFGGSYGGYSAYWQLVQYPSLYDAGVAWIGLTDLEEMYETTMPHFRTELMEKYLGSPADDPDLYAERSPITHAENLDAPLLVVHGVNDRRVPVSQARLFRDRLEELGYERGPDGDFEYRELGEEGHASSDIDQQKRMFRLLAAFLERRVGDSSRD